MRSYKTVPLTSQRFDSLRRCALAGPEKISFLQGPRELLWIASLGIAREVGTVNDELSQFTYDAGNGERVSREKMRAEVIELQGHYGVRIWVQGCESIEVRVKGFPKLLHPEFSFDADGRINQLVFFPESIARVLALEGIELVFIREWAMNTIFGGFHPAEGFYQTNLWELVNNDSQRFARLVQERQLPLLGTHDLVAHIAGVQGSDWPALVEEARELRETLEAYFEGVENPHIASRILPYAAGVVLDDLAQPPNYGKPARRAVLKALLDGIRRSEIRPSQQKLLLRFPQAYEKIIHLSRSEDREEVKKTAESLVLQLEREIQAASFLMDGPSASVRVPHLLPTRRRLGRLGSSEGG